MTRPVNNVWKRPINAGSSSCKWHNGYTKSMWWPCNKPICNTLHIQSATSSIWVLVNGNFKAPTVGKPTTSTRMAAPLQPPTLMHTKASRSPTTSGCTEWICKRWNSTIQSPIPVVRCTERHLQKLQKPKKKKPLLQRFLGSGGSGSGHARSRHHHNHTSSSADMCGMWRGVCGGGGGGGGC